MQCAGQTAKAEVNANWQRLGLGVIQQRAAQTSGGVDGSVESIGSVRGYSSVQGQSAVV